MVGKNGIRESKIVGNSISKKHMFGVDFPNVAFFIYVQSLLDVYAKIIILHFRKIESPALELF